MRLLTRLTLSESGRSYFQIYTRENTLYFVLLSEFENDSFQPRRIPNQIENHLFGTRFEGVLVGQLDFVEMMKEEEFNQVLERELNPSINRSWLSE